jgi:hypothetical protein
MAHSSTRTTGDDPAEGVDPGGTRPTKPGNPDKTGPKGESGSTAVEQNVESGDRNTRPPS